MAHPGSKQELKPFDPKFIFGGVEETSAEERTTHAGSCHCGAVKYNVTLKWPFPKYPVNRCTCSICTTSGYLLVYPCRRDVEWVQGYENLQDYKWNSERVTHKFCKTCGTRVGIDFLRAEGKEDPSQDMLAFNVRTFNDIDLDSLEYSSFDGKNLIPLAEKK